MIAQENRLLVRPSKKWQMFTFLFVLVTYFILLMSFIMYSPDEKFSTIATFRLEDDKFSLTPFLIAFGLFFSIVYAILHVYFLTPYAYLLLTPEGFVTHSWLKSRNRHYRWDEVSAFYVGETTDSEGGTKKCVAFDSLAIPSGKNRRKILDSPYSKSPKAMVGELNQWRDQYALLEPDDDFSVPDSIALEGKELLSAWALVALSLWIASSLTVLYFLIQKIQLSLTL